MTPSFRQRIAGSATRDTGAPAAMVDEHAVRAAAGLTMLIGAVAFSCAYFDRNYVPLQIVTAVFFADFLTRVTLGLRYSPTGALGHALTRAQAPQWVSARPKRFAWTLGLAMSASMVVITNTGVRGLLPRTICLICLSLMWMESVLGLCLGCKIHALLVQRGRIAKDAAFEVCAHGECELPADAVDA
jgi:uncharacterized protein DUF4395